MHDEFPDDPVTRGAEARLALAEGRTGDAAATLRELMKTNESAEGQRLLALAEQQLGNLDAAVAAIDRAVALAGPLPAYYRTKARIHFDAKQWGQVILAYRVLAGRGQRFTPSDELRHIQALYGLGRTGDARQALAALLARPDPPVEAVVEYAKREGAANPAPARAALEAALVRTPGDPRALESLATLDVAEGHPEHAIARIDEEINAGRARPRTLFLRAQLLAAQGDLARAEADVLRAFEAAPALPGAVELLFDIYRRQNRLAEAQRSFEQADSAGVLHVGGRLLLARLYASQGDTAKAQAALERVIAENPQMGSAKNDLAFLVAQRGEQLERAVELAREARRALPENAATLDTLGYVYYRAGRPEAALVELRRAVELAERPGAPIAPIYPYHLGLVLQALGRNDEAARAFERALANAEGFPEADDARRRLESVLATSAPGANAS
jgi:tetratricopeptide (TPR) repeat protein